MKLEGNAPSAAVQAEIKTALPAPHSRAGQTERHQEWFNMFRSTMELLANSLCMCSSRVCVTRQKSWKVYNTVIYCLSVGQLHSEILLTPKSKENIL